MMRSALDLKQGKAELGAACRQDGGLFLVVALFSFFVNALMLTSPIFMLQVYDRVLGSRSVETLVALSILVAFLFLMMGLLDIVRGRILARIGARFQARLDARVFDAALRQEMAGPVARSAATAGRDLEALRGFLASPAFAALYDLPWTPIFIVGIFVFHPWLGFLALGGGGGLVLLALVNQWVSRSPLQETRVARLAAERRADQFRNHSETVRGLGMRQSAFLRWQSARLPALGDDLKLHDRSGSFSAATRTGRLALQSAMLALGAYLVLQGQLTPGAMIAASILLGRALSPVEILIGQWRALARAKGCWTSLAILVGAVPPEAHKTSLPKPKAALDVQHLTVVPPGEKQGAIRMLSFSLRPGQVIGVIGQSGAGKSTLARAIAGVWSPAGGRIRLDHASIGQYPPDTLGRHIGYLPQSVRLFDGTIAENIARLDPDPDAVAVIEAAKKAAVHEMIVALPEGYDTWINADGGRLSGGQIQRIGLARALYGDPVLLVLDEPNSSLDSDGSGALNTAIRRMKAAGKSAIIMAHRPAAIAECDLLLMLDGGVRRAFGPRDEVLREVVQPNPSTGASLAGGVS